MSRLLNVTHAVGLITASLLSANAFALKCSYAVNNDWGSGFTSNITVTNDSTSAITGWQVQWRQNGNSTISSSWNANVTGSNPYIARHVDWNGAIAPGASQSFGVQGNGEDSTATIVSCSAAGANTSSLLSSAASSRAVSSAIILPSSKSSTASSAIILSSSKSSSSLASTDSTFTLEENTTGFCGVEGTIDSNHTGYRGVGFANADNENGKGIDYAISVPANGNYHVKFRYANGAAARAANLSVNNVNAGNLSFAAGAWTSWVETPAITVSLKQGNNLLRLQATDSNGLANIDSVSISGNRPTAGQCASNNGPITLWIAGDSTVANGGPSCAFGWGRDFGSHFNSNVSVQNLAVGGRSVRTWLYDVQSTIGSDGECALNKDSSGNTIIQSRWQTTLAGMKRGDYLFIQFGINDGSTTCPRHVGSNAFMQEYRMMAEAARARGATPIFITPVSAIRCSGNTAVASRGFLSETINLGASMNVPVIDLHQRSIQLYNQRGFCPIPGGAVNASTGGAVGEFFCDDHTHFDLGGAKDIGGLVAQGIRDLNLPLAQHFKTNSTETVNVYLAGDSIVQSYTDTASTSDQAGWGQMLPQQYKSNVIIHNHAAGGRSARRFIDEGRLNAIWGEAKRGDYLLVQFGTNDGHKTATYTLNGQTIPYYLEPGTDFKKYLSQYITGARSRGINLALVTPTPRNSAYCTGGNGTGAWAQAMRELAAAEGIPLIDLNLKTVNYLKGICPAPTPENFFFRKSDGSVDGTHFQENGARILARLVADGVAESGMMLNNYRK
ncbi:MAG TPA: cellulose binding domain-containing protein [Cellvibrio sp.]|nr:cellulose binding domain-containing protein [Cellvibrio sp.]